MRHCPPHLTWILTLIFGPFDATVAMADVFHMGPGLTSLDFVTVGNPGNPGEVSGTGGWSRITGKVDYPFQMGKFEVTTAQYTEFLNAVAADDHYGLYDTKMWTSPLGCKIERLGSSGSYYYRVAVDRANRPVNSVSTGDAARFCNWLANGQPSGAQNLTTTENGSYLLNGAMHITELPRPARKASATFVLPNEDEWYKAAYHKNDGPTGNYWDYPMSSDAFPGNSLDPDSPNNANILLTDYAIGSPYWYTEAGTFRSSPSPYGTFDQGGNIYEYTEDVFPGSNTIVVRGGSALGLVSELRADQRMGTTPSNDAGWGFRIARVPEPSTLSLIAIISFGLIRRPR